MKRKILFLIAVTISILALLAFQSNTTRILSGTVYDPYGSVLDKVNIEVEGTNIKTSSKSDGSFKIEVSENATTLIFSKDDYHTRKVEIGFRSNYTVRLYPLVEKVTFRPRDSGFHPTSIDADKSMIMEEMSMSRERESLTPAPAKTGAKRFESSYHRESHDISLKSGTLTAGEWNDLNNWEAWKTLLTNKNFEDMESYWDFNLGNRYSFFLTNKYELPIVDATVVLRNSSGKIIWQAKTDNAGKAELWSQIYSEEKASTSLFIEVEHGRKVYKVSSPQIFEDGVNHLQIPVECNAEKNVDIMFVVDATGSMGDEILYLKQELEDVMSRVKAVDRDLDFRLGSVFYRDKGDAFVTRQTGLSSDISKSIEFIRSNHAGGGGDYPEAVHAGLEEAIMQDWSRSAMARIIFLLLDAPPPPQFRSY